MSNGNKFHVKQTDFAPLFPCEIINFDLSSAQLPLYEVHTRRYRCVLSDVNQLSLRSVRVGLLRLHFQRAYGSMAKCYCWINCVFLQTTCKDLQPHLRKLFSRLPLRSDHMSRFGICRVLRCYFANSCFVVPRMILSTWADVERSCARCVGARHAFLRTEAILSEARSTADRLYRMTNVMSRLFAGLAFAKGKKLESPCLWLSAKQRCTSFGMCDRGCRSTG